MDWVEGDTLGIWLDKHFDDRRALEKACTDFAAIARFLELKGIAHGRHSERQCDGRQRRHQADRLRRHVRPRHAPGQWQRDRAQALPASRSAGFRFRSQDDRFSFIALDLSLKAVIEDKSLYSKFREGGETVIFKANDFADPENSEIFQRLLAMPKLKEQARNFAAICGAPLAAVPTLDGFLAGRNIPAAKMQIKTSPSPAARPPAASYISAYPVVDALNFSAAMQRVGDRVRVDRADRRNQAGFT